MSSIAVVLGISFGVAAVGCAVPSRDAAWPKPLASEQELRSEDEARVVAQPVCVGARSWSAGALGDTVLYRTRRVGKKLAVGYFVYWSEERPWGSNSLSYTVIPALATDAVYSHFLYLFPGIKDALYGPGDIEGVQVLYEQREDGSLSVVSGHADNGNHTPVQLTQADLVDSKGRLILLSDVWSHQLGTPGAAAFVERTQQNLKCYAPSAIRPMTELVHRAPRARPARSSSWRRPSPARSSTDRAGPSPLLLTFGAKFFRPRPFTRSRESMNRSEIEP